MHLTDCVIDSCCYFRLMLDFSLGGVDNLRPCRPPREYLGEYISRGKPKIPPADRIREEECLTVLLVWLYGELPWKVGELLFWSRRPWCLWCKPEMNKSITYVVLLMYRHTSFCSRTNSGLSATVIIRKYTSSIHDGWKFSSRCQLRYSRTGSLHCVFFARLIVKVFTCIPHLKHWRAKYQPSSKFRYQILISDYVNLTLYRHIKTAEQRTIIQQYGEWYIGHWWVSCYIWYSEEGPGRCDFVLGMLSTRCLLYMINYNICNM